MRSDRLFWGLAFIFFGGLLLLQNLGLLPPNLNLWALIWPAVLIFFGLRLLLRSTGQGAGRFFATRADDARAETGSLAQTERGAAARGEVVRAPLGEARRAAVRFHHGAGELRVDAEAAPDELFSGTFVGGLEHTSQPAGDEVRVDLRPPEGSLLPLMGDRLDWTVGLNPNIPLTLEMDLGASRNWIDLRRLMVKELRLQTGASETQLYFPERAGETRATVKSGAAAMEIFIPENVSARIRAHGGLASIAVDTQRFPQTGGGAGAGIALAGEYASPDYEVAANRLDLDIETGMGAVTVR